MKLIRYPALVCLCNTWLLLPASAWLSHTPVPRPRTGRTARFNPRLEATATPSSDNAREMNEWIRQLSLEPTDESRRNKLEQVISQKYNDHDFCDLFDQELTLLGDQIKQQAALAAQQQQQQQQPSEDDSEDTSVPEKTPKMKQLWAMIDLMIHKKTLVKKAREGSD